MADIGPMSYVESGMCGMSATDKVKGTHHLQNEVVNELKKNEDV